MPRQITMRADGRPSGSTVARVIACAFRMSAKASFSQASRSGSGSGGRSAGRGGLSIADLYLTASAGRLHRSGGRCRFTRVATTRTISVGSIGLRRNTSNPAARASRTPNRSEKNVTAIAGMSERAGRARTNRMSSSPFSPGSSRSQTMMSTSAALRSSLASGAEPAAITAAPNGSSAATRSATESRWSSTTSAVMSERTGRSGAFMTPRKVRRPFTSSVCRRGSGRATDADNEWLGGKRGGSASYRAMRSSVVFGGFGGGRRGDGDDRARGIAIDPRARRRARDGAGPDRLDDHASRQHRAHRRVGQHRHRRSRLGALDEERLRVETEHAGHERIAVVGGQVQQDRQYQDSPQQYQ